MFLRLVGAPGSARPCRPGCRVADGPLKPVERTLDGRFRYAGLLRIQFAALVEGIIERPPVGGTFAGYVDRGLRHRPLARFHRCISHARHFVHR